MRNSSAFVKPAVPESGGLLFSALSPRDKARMRMMRAGQFGVPVLLSLFAGGGVGLGVAALAYGGAFVYTRWVNNDSSFDKNYEKASIAPALSGVVADFCRRVGIAPRPVRLVDDKYGLNYIGHHAATTCRAIYVSPNTLRSFNMAEQKFIMAHEVAHLHHNDVKALGVDRLARWGGFALGILGVGALCANALVTGSITAGGMALSWAGVAYVHHYAQQIMAAKLSRDMEYRADAGALCLTRDFNAAVRMMDKIYDKGPGGIWDDDEPEKTGLEHLEKLFGGHPTYDDRVSALSRTWRRIRDEDVALEKARGNAAKPNPQTNTPRP